MLRILIPADGSENSLRAITFPIKKATLFLIHWAHHT